MNQQAEVTIVIPTYNRSKFLARLLNYYASKNPQINFLILDSGDDASKKINEQMVTSCKLNARYVTFSSDISVATKLLEGLKLVETPYCTFCADDDIVFIDGLTQALAFLKKHPEHVCVDGIYLNFNPVGNDINLVVEYATRGIEAESSGARVFRLCQKYESLFYGAFRTQDAIKIFSGVAKNSSLHYQELFQAVAALLIGKSHRLPVFYAGRQHCNPADMTRDKWQTYYWFGDNAKEFLEHYTVYRKELWDFYRQHSSDKNLDKATFDKAMDISHAMYFGLGCPPQYFHTVLQAEWPNDEYRKSNKLHDDVCNELKSKRRVWLESTATKFSKWLPEALPSLASLRNIKNVKQLNYTVHKQAKNKWNCKLSKDLRWLAGDENFRNAYVELCKYMEF